MYEYIVCLCVSERESGVSEKSSGKHKPAGPVCHYKYLAAFRHVFYEYWGQNLSIPKHPSGFNVETKLKLKENRIGWRLTINMLIIFLTRSCISYKICCYYSSAVVIIGRFSIFLAIFFFFGFDIWRISLFSFTPFMLFLRVSSEK